MFRYNVYGKCIHSTLLLPELTCADAPADIIIRRGERPYVRPEEITEEGCIRATDDEAYVCWKDVGSFMLTGGREIIYTPVPGVERLLSLCILGPVLAVLLHQMGHPVLHASAVAGPRGALVFMGECGCGKSTIAAALWAHGFPLVTDDVLTIIDENDSLMVAPGTPNIKILPEAARTLGYLPEELPGFSPDLDKRSLHLDTGTFPHPLPIECAFVISEGDTQEIEPLSASEAMIETIRHSYCARILNGQRVAMHFGQCARLAESTGFRRLKIEKDLTMLPDLPRMLVDDIAAGTR